jgi:hypothetical protein
MTQPSPQQVALALDLLREDADAWAEAAARLAGASTRASSLRIDRRLILPIWDEFLTVYNQVVDLVAARTAEGDEAMTAIGGTLRTVADEFEHDEREIRHNIQRLR